MRISKSFTFEASHQMTWLPADHPGARLHGHSYHATIVVEGEPDETGRVFWFEGLRSIVEALRFILDHQHLNDVELLKQPPTLEHLALLVRDVARTHARGTVEATVARPSEGESATA